MNIEKPQFSYTNRELVADVWSYVKPYKSRFILASCIRVISDLTSLVPAFAFSLLVNYITHFSLGAPLTRFWLIVALWAAAVSISYPTNNVSKKICYGLGEAISLDAYAKGLRHLFKLDILWHEKENSGNKLKKIERGGDALRKIMYAWVKNIIQIVINFITIFLVVLNFNPLVAVGLMVYGTIFVLLVKPFLKRAAIAERAVDDEEEDLHGLTFEAMNNIRTIKVLGIEPSLRIKIEKKCRNLLEKILIRVKYFQNRWLAQQLLSQLFKVAMMILAAYGVFQGRYEVGFLVMFNIYFNRITESVEELSDLSEVLTISKIQLSRLQNLLREPANIDSEEGKVDFPSEWKKIEVKNLSFSYGDNEVLKNISFTINRGERTGIVGMSGAGKSTLFKLLLKEIENFRGEILIDGISLKNIKRSSFYNYTAVVLQDTEVFNFSLRDNITIANLQHEKNDKLIKTATSVAHVSDYLPKLPQGYETLIGEKGIKLSGGEKQRLGIARAVFKQPQLLLLDEATSHLDLESEEKIKDSLHQFFQNVTAIVIAHRLTTIKEMDRIIVLEDGRIVEEGNFESLYTTKGRFFDLWEKQKL